MVTSAATVPTSPKMWKVSVIKVQVSPFVASSGGTTVVAAVVGQAPVPQQTRASRASTRATARAS